MTDPYKEQGPDRLYYKIQAGDFTALGRASVDVKRELIRLGVPAEDVRRAAIAMYEGEVNMAIHAGGGVAEADIYPDRIEITFTDNGPGIPPDRLHQIFDPFFTTKGPGEGTGLGLSICYSIMEGLGGDVSATNHSGGGAEFTIRLPTSNSAGGSM